MSDQPSSNLWEVIRHLVYWLGGGAIAMIVLFTIVLSSVGPKIAQVEPLPVEVQAAPAKVEVYASAKDYITASRKSVRIIYCTGMIKTTGDFFGLMIRKAQANSIPVPDEMTMVHDTSVKLFGGSTSYLQFAATFIDIEAKDGLPTPDIQAIGMAAVQRANQLLKAGFDRRDQASVASLLSEVSTCVLDAPKLIDEAIERLRRG